MNHQELHTNKRRKGGIGLGILLVLGFLFFAGTFFAYTNFFVEKNHEHVLEIAEKYFTAVDSVINSPVNTRLGTLAFPPSTVEGTSTAGWTDDGSIVRLNTASDFVGIGTANPLEKLSVIGGNIYTSGDLYAAGGDIFLGTGSATTTLTSASGNLGIASSSPAFRLSVIGDAYFSGTTTMGVLNVASSTTWINNVRYSWPSSQGAVTTILQNDGSGGLTWSTLTASTSLVSLNMTAGTNINSLTIPQAVMATSSQRVGLADADSTATGTQDFFGFALKGQNVTNGQSVIVGTTGIIDGFSGLTVGSLQYLSANAGSITETVPSWGAQVVGVAVTDQRVLIMPNNAGTATGTLQYTVTTAAGTQDFFQATGWRPRQITMSYSCDPDSTDFAAGVASHNTHLSLVSFGNDTPGGVETFVTTPTCNDSTGSNAGQSTLSIQAVSSGGFTIRITRDSAAGSASMPWTVTWQASR